MRQQGHSCGLVAVTAVAVLLGVGGAGTASAKSKAKTKQTALFLITSGGPNPEVVQAIARALPAVTRRAPRLNLVTGMELRRRIGSQPNKALSACGADFGCLAKLGAKADAKTMVIVRVTPGEAGTRVQFVIIDVTDKVMRARIELDISTAAEVEPQLERNFFNIFGVGLPKTPKPATDPIAAAEPAATTSTPAPDTATASAATTAEPAGKADTIPESNVEPGNARPETIAKRSDTGLDLEFIPELETVAATPPAQEPTIAADYVMYAGIGLAGVGIIVGVIGAVFGSNGVSAGAAITDNVPQTDAIRRRDEANAQIEMANIMYIAGGATAGVGVIMIVLGLIEPGFLGGGQANVTVANGGAQLSLRLPW